MDKNKNFALILAGAMVTAAIVGALTAKYGQTVYTSALSLGAKYRPIQNSNLIHQCPRTHNRAILKGTSVLTLVSASTMCQGKSFITIQLFARNTVNVGFVRKLRPEPLAGEELKTDCSIASHWGRSGYRSVGRFFWIRGKLNAAKPSYAAHRVGSIALHSPQVVHALRAKPIYLNLQVELQSRAADQI